jgi:hypothetical protein
MNADIVVVLISNFLFIVSFLLSAKSVCIYTYLTVLIFMKSILITHLCVAYIVAISTSTWNCISIGSMENKAN